MLLAVDSGILPLKVEPEIIEPCMTQIVLTLTNIIVSIPNHPYMSYHKAERAVLIVDRLQIDLLVIAHHILRVDRFQIYLLASNFSLFKKSTIREQRNSP
jgi:hypothetical protein